MLIGILEWFYVALLGLKVGEDGWRSFTVAPSYTSEFGEVKGSFVCPYGMIEVGFKRGKSGDVVLRLTVPMSTEPTVMLPDGTEKVQITREVER